MSDNIEFDIFPEFPPITENPSEDKCMLMADILMALDEYDKGSEEKFFDTIGKINETNNNLTNLVDNETSF